MLTATRAVGPLHVLTLCHHLLLLQRLSRLVELQLGGLEGRAQSLHLNAALALEPSLDLQYTLAQLRLLEEVETLAHLLGRRVDADATTINLLERRPINRFHGQTTLTPNRGTYLNRPINP